MPVLTPETVIPGVVYVVWVKESKSPGAFDGLYALISKSASKFGYSDFLHLCEACHGKLFLSQKVNNGEENPTWADCLDDLKVFKPPVGSPIVLTQKVYSFAEVTQVAYDQGYFSSEDGLNRLKKKLTSKSGGKSKPSVSKEPAISDSKVLATAKEMSDKLENVNKSGASVSSNPFPPGPPPAVVDTPKVLSLEETSGSLGDGVEGDLSLALLEVGVWKERAHAAETRNRLAEDDKLQMAETITDLEVKLESSLDHQKQYMMVGDRKTQDIEALNQDTAGVVVAKLESKLVLLDSVDSNLGSVLAKVSTVLSRVEALPGLVSQNVEGLLSGQSVELGKGIDAVSSRLDTVHDSISETVTATRDVLENFGMTESDDDAVDIPASLQLVLTSLSSLPAPAVVDHASGGVSPVDTLCFYKTRGMMALYVCKCGCQHVVVVDTKELVDVGSSSSPGDLTGDYFDGNNVSQQSFHTPLPVVSQDTSTTPPGNLRKRKKKSKKKKAVKVQKLSFGSGVCPDQSPHLSEPMNPVPTGGHTAPGLRMSGPAARQSCQVSQSANPCSEDQLGLGQTGHDQTSMTFVARPSVGQSLVSQSGPEQFGHERHGLGQFQHWQSGSGQSDQWQPDNGQSGQMQSGTGYSGLDKVVWV